MAFPQRLLDGYIAFVDGRLTAEQARFRELAEHGQRPQIMVIGCCDSRVSPEVIFDASPGELFVVRNVANLVPPYSPDSAHRAVSAAVEFAVQALVVRHVVVLGHARCGGIQAFVERGRPLSSGDFIGRWMSLIEPAVAATPQRPDESDAQYLARIEHASLARTLDNLLTFPWLAARVRAGTLELHAAYFDVATGLLTVRDPRTGEFAPARPPASRQ